jgi:hypothetical protein
MPWRGVAPIQLVIVLVGGVALITAVGMVLIAAIAVMHGDDVSRSIPNPLATTCIASLTGLSGLLTPNTGLTMSARTARHATLAGQAAATAVVEHEQLHDLATEAEHLRRETRD